MKKLLLLSFLILTSHYVATGQVISGETIILVESVIDSKGTQNDLHEKVTNWFGKSFKSAKNVITSDTQSAIAGTYINGYIFGGAHQVNWSHTIQVDIKDDKVRLRIWLVDNNPVYYFFNKKGQQRGMYKKGLAKLVADSKALEVNFQDFLINSINDDW